MKIFLVKIKYKRHRQKTPLKNVWETLKKPRMEKTGLENL